MPTHAVKNTSWISRFFKDIIHLDKSSFSLAAGLRAAVFIIAPIILAFAIQQPALFLAAIGAIVLTATAKMLPTISSRILLLACFTDAASFGLGTLAATTGHLLSPVLLAIAVFAALAVWANTKYEYQHIIIFIKKLS